RVRVGVRLARLSVARGGGESFTRQRCGGCGHDTRARAKRAQELTTAERRLAFSFHRRLLLYPSLRSELLRGQRESIGLDIYKHPAEPSYSPVEIRGLGLFQIRKEAPDPRREMLLEQFAIGIGGSGGTGGATHPPDLTHAHP